MEQLFNFVRQYGEVLQSDLDLMAAYAKSGNLKPGQFLLRAGEVCHQHTFILTGVIRIFVIDKDGREIVRNFPSESNIIIDLESYPDQLPSIEYWEAITEVEYIYWTRADFEYLQPQIPYWDTVKANMTQKILVANTNERTEMFSDDASTRYRKFLERYPDLIARVPLRHIANYLGIAPQSLSRIRQQIGKHKPNTF